LNEKGLRVRDLVDELIQLISKSRNKIGKGIIQQFELEKQMPFLSEGKKKDYTFYDKLGIMYEYSRIDFVFSVGPGFTTRELDS
jgi:hypothetical protein